MTALLVIAYVIIGVGCAIAWLKWGRQPADLAIFILLVWPIAVVMGVMYELIFQLFWIWRRFNER